MLSWACITKKLQHLLPASMHATLLYDFVNLRISYLYSEVTQSWHRLQNAERKHYKDNHMYDLQRSLHQ